MIGDDDLIGERGLTGREAVVERERGYIAGRRRGRRLARREREEDFVERDTLFGGGFGGLGFGGGFGLGGGGAALLVIGLVLMAIAYFGIGFDDAFSGFSGYSGYGAYDSGGTAGFSPSVNPYEGGGYGGGGDLAGQRPMMFMGGGFLFLAGCLLAVASRLRMALTD